MASPYATSKRRRFVRLFGPAIIVGYTLACTIVFLAQRKMLYIVPDAPRGMVGRGQVVNVPGGHPMLWLEGAPDAPVVVYFHGNAGQIADCAWTADIFAARNIGFAAVEYPGFGLARGQGTPDEASIYASARAAIAHLKTGLNIAPERLVLMGRSLGSGVAVQLASEGVGTKLVLLTPYTSIPDLAQAIYPWFPAWLLAQDRFNSADKAPRIPIPVLVVHGMKDEIVPVGMGLALAARFPSASFVGVADVGHDEIWDRMHVQRRILDFTQGLNVLPDDGARHFKAETDAD